MAASKNLELACLQFEDHSTCDTQFLARCRPGLFRETTDHRLGLGQRHILLEGVLGRDGLCRPVRNDFAALPQLRKQKQGLVLWVSSSSAAGGTPPYLAPYFAAKAAMDALAVVYARELARWGIETSIIVPGAFTGGTNHFAHADSPSDEERVAEYEAGPYKGFADDIMKGFASIVPREADVSAVAEAIVKVVDTPV